MHVAREFTDAELKLVAEFVAHRCLEVERGLRGKDCLKRFLSAEAYSQQFSEAASRFAKGGIVRPDDLGRMVFQRTQDGHVHITIPARQENDRWGALVMEMRSTARGVWRVTELTRAQDRNLAHPRLAMPWREPADPEPALALVARETLEVQMAHTVAAQRHDKALAELARLTPEKPAAELQIGDVINVDAAPTHSWIEVRSVLHDEAKGNVSVLAPDGTALRIPADRPVAVLQVFGGDIDAARRAAAAATQEVTARAEEMVRWDRRLGSLEGERGELVERGHVRDQLMEPSEAPAGPPDYVIRTLGAPPEHSSARKVWDEAADVITGYRDRWNVEATTSLGPRPEDPEQCSDREATVATLRQLRSRLEVLAVDDDQKVVGRNAREDVGRDPFAMAVSGERR
jgi:hypothetical protein